MVVRVDGEDYVVQRPHGSKANVRLADGSNHQCKRLYRLGTHRLETDLEMQTRVQERVTKLNAGQERAQPLSARLILGSPALSASASIILTTEVECADAGNRRQTGGARTKASAHEAFAALGWQLRPPCPTRRPRLRGPPKATRTTLLRFPACHRPVLGAAGRCPRSQPTSAGQRSTRRPLPCSNRASPRGQSRSWSTELTLTPALTRTLTRTTDPSPDPDPKPQPKPNSNPNPSPDTDPNPGHNSNPGPNSNPDPDH